MALALGRVLAPAPFFEHALIARQDVTNTTASPSTASPSSPSSGSPSQSPISEAPVEVTICGDTFNAEDFPGYNPNREPICDGVPLSQLPPEQPLPAPGDKYCGAGKVVISVYERCPIVDTSTPPAVKPPTEGGTSPSPGSQSPPSAASAQAQPPASNAQSQPSGNASNSPVSAVSPDSATSNVSPSSTNAARADDVVTLSSTLNPQAARPASQTSAPSGLTSTSTRATSAGLTTTRRDPGVAQSSGAADGQIAAPFEGYKVRLLSLGAIVFSFSLGFAAVA